MEISSKRNSGRALLLFSLFFYVLLKLPSDLAIICPGENEGLSFIYGQNFLLHKDLVIGRGLLFVLAYTFILKIFGFNTYSIIAVHFMQTIIIILSGIAIYLMVKRVVKEELYSGLAVLLWILMLMTPVGASGIITESRSHYALEPEVFCVFFSLYSILCLSLGNYFDTSHKSKPNAKEKLFLFLAGVLAVCSFMFKASGAVLLIATFFWFLFFLFFRRESFNILTENMTFYLCGALVSLIFFDFILYLLTGDLTKWWRNYFLIGSYNHDYLNSPLLFLKSVYHFMTRYTSSVNNFLLFFLGITFFLAGACRCFFSRNNMSPFLFFWGFISIWGIGNTVAVITPGSYQPYYYHLVWPCLAIVVVLGLQFLLGKINVSFIRAVVISALLILFAFRVFTVCPAYCKNLRVLLYFNVFNQPQSFEDPVLPYNPATSKRFILLRLADMINQLLPDKDDTFYIFNFSPNGFTSFTPLSYIYAKRYPPTTIDCGLLRVPTIVKDKLIILQQNLSDRPPELLVISEDNYFIKWQMRTFKSFLNWFEKFISTNYKYETKLTYKSPKRQETFLVYRKIK